MLLSDFCVNLYKTNSLEGLGLFQFNFQSKMEREINNMTRRHNSLSPITTIPYNRISLNE